jgi:two-component system, cell cycle response regulator DivK
VALRVWVVEDDMHNFELVDFLLSEAGFEIVQAASAGELRALLASRPTPDLVLMDMQLPGASGLELVAELRADARHRGAIVVALTAQAMRGDRERFLAAGCDDYISKPIDTAAFVDNLRAILASGRSASGGD